MSFAYSSTRTASVALYALLALALCLSLVALVPAGAAQTPDTDLSTAFATAVLLPSPVPSLNSTNGSAALSDSLAARRLDAVPGNVVINEVVTDPQTDWSSSDFSGAVGVGPITDSDEFVELYIKAAGLNLSGWTIELSDTSPTSGGLNAGGAFAVARYVGPGSPAATQIGAFLVLGNPSGSLNNTILITLKDNGGQVIDQVQIGGDGAPEGDATSIDDEAIARFPNGIDTGSDGSDFVQQPASLGADNATGAVPPNDPTATPTDTPSDAPPTPTPTVDPGEPTATNTPYPAISGVVLNELMPRGAEFIELYNTTGAAVDLSGWRLDDSPGGTSPYTLPPSTVILPFGFLVFDQSVTGVGLNDTGDTARLLRPDDSVADEFSYAPAPPAQYSLARVPDGGAWNARGLPSPGAPNQADPLLASNAAAIGAFRTWPDGAWVTVVGRVSVLPGTFSPRTIHVQDASGGVTLYLGRDDWPPLALGQTMQVLGYLRHRSGELQVYVRNGWHVHAGPADDLAPAPPLAALTNQIGEATEGQLVTVTGVVTQLEESALWLDDGSGPARVFFPASAGLPRPPAQAGQTWRITGAVVEFTTDPAHLNFRLQPRAAADVVQLVNGQPVPYVPAASPPPPDAPEPTATPEP